MKNKKSFLFLAVLMIATLAFSQHKKHQTKKAGANTANEFMHQSSTEDLIKRFESAERDAYQKPEVVLQYLGDLNNKKIMDIGAGSGYFSVKLAEKGAKVIAADVSDEFQSALKERIEKNKLKNIEIRKIPFDSPGLSDQEVDMVLIVNTYHHIEDRSAYFIKVKNGIKETGELVVIDFFKSSLPVGPPTDHKISIDVVIAELKEAGYTSFELTVDLLPYQYIIKAK
ncbi:class I SAM-dependent methyltransferase [Eudoraea chungangensis]|uniref:class I SAM-dependent methyltransferase n=1 Tax=Eudoraea chungangensis TaxID=1481905 RepID=UPI0023ED65F7|nr:class I SAM-dependent methyltransferase [Eudoraea chungangensis]